MATIDKEIDKILNQINQKLSQTDQCLDQIIQYCNAKGAKVLSILKMAMEELNESHEDLKWEFYELLTPFSGKGNIDNLDLSQLQEEVLRVIGTKEKDEYLVGLVEDLEGFEKRVEEINERVIELMTDFNIVPKGNEVKKITPFNHAKEVGIEKSDEGLKGKENGVFRLSDVAIEMYGFPGDVAFHIEASLKLRKLIQNDTLFNMDEAEIFSLYEDSDSDNDPFLEKTARERGWVKIKKLKRVFEKLQKKIYKKRELDLKVAPKEGNNGDEDPESLRISFLRVIRNWIFHIESVLFDLIYELYHKLGNQTAESIFQTYKFKLENLMEINHGRVPITVYKVIEMMGNRREFKVKGSMVIMTLIVGCKRVYKQIKLKDLMGLVHKIILRLRLVLFTSGLSYAKTITADESDLCENMLQESEEEVRNIERKVNGAQEF